MAINKNFVIKNGLEVADSLLVADSALNKVGIGTTDLEYSADIRGDIAVSGKIYVTPENPLVGVRTGTASANTRDYITGINTSGVKINDILSDGAGGIINSKVISVGISSLQIYPIHGRTTGSIDRSISISRRVSPGNLNDILVSRGEDLPPIWKTPESESTRVISTDVSDVHYPLFVTGIGITTLKINEENLSFIPSTGNLGLGVTSPTEKLDVSGNINVSSIVSASILSANNAEITSTARVGFLSATDASVSQTATIGFVDATNASVSGTATVGFLTATNVSVAETVTSNTVDAITYFGNGVNLTGIVTQITAGIGVTLTATQNPGKGVVNISAYYPIGKTVFVTQNGNDANSGLTENDSKKTIKAAAAIAFPGDTIKVYPGVYVEDNPVYLSKRVSVEGTELRNCIVTPKNLDRDLFYVNNSCHITDLSFIGPNMTNNAAIIALQPLLGVSTDRFFDASRMIRFNLDYIAKEAVGFLTSTQYIGAGRTQVSDPVFEVVDALGNPVDPSNCSDDIKDIFKAVIHDITRGGNSKCVGAGLSYYSDGALVHIGGTDANGYSVKEATIDTIRYATDIARAIINNVTWGSNPVGVATDVTNALYDNVTGVTTITALNHGLVKDDAVKIVGLGFTCPSGPGIVTYPSGAYGYIFNVKSVINSNEFEVVVGQSTLPHTYDSGGTVQKYENFQNQYTQVKDVSIQSDPDTGFNDAINGCANVVSAIYSCVGVVTTIIDQGPSVLGSGINTTFPGNRGTGTSSLLGITSAVYDNVTGQTTILAPSLSVKVGDIVELRDLLFECESSGVIGTQRYPSGAYGYEFDVTEINDNGSFVVNTGISTIAHTYVGGGYVVNRAIGVTTAVYDNLTGITTITAPGASLRVGDYIKLHDLEFTCTSGAATTTLYPTGNLGYEFKVVDVVGSGTTFVVNTGVSTIPHTYVSGGVVFPPYSPGVGPITQGPYIRNCTNFVGGSIGMKVDGFDAEPGDQDDIGVTGTMSVDSYTQYNQGGIGVSITNGAYSQLVSIFTICDEIAIFTGSGGQCDITNSNSSFGNKGLVSDGVGDYTTKSIYHHTGIAYTTAEIEQDTIILSGLGNLRPYDGQTLHFGELYYEVQSILVTDGGSGYTIPPNVTIDLPTGPSGIRAEASANIDSDGKVTSIDVISTGSQYRLSDSPTITIESPGVGVTATAQLNFYPIYYTIESATLPVAGISTVVLNTNLNNTVSAGTTAYLNRLSLQITSSHSFEWVGAGNDINTAKPALGGVVIQENEVIKLNGGEVVYTSTDQAGNFKIGDGMTINQLTGTISGRSFSQSLLNTVTPLIIALGN
jgi:hypothetical protein